MVEKKKKDLEWYDNPNMIVALLLGLNIVVIILSQAFAIKNNLSGMAMFRTILNHNSTYIMLLVYFAFLMTKFGKKYFNFLNIILIIFYALVSIASLLTVFQSFGLSSLVYLLLYLIIFIYLVGTFLRDTRFWKELDLEKIPFDEVTNDWYFYAIILLSVVYLAVNLISADTFDGIVLSTLGTICIMLFARYIYLYKAYLESKKKIKKGEKEQWTYLKK